MGNDGGSDNHREKKKDAGRRKIRILSRGKTPFNGSLMGWKKSGSMVMTDGKDGLG